MNTRVEVCIDSAEGLAACIAGGAHRIEPCSALAVGGLTPSVGLMAVAANSPIPVRVMIRPRSGSFVYSPADLTQMFADIDAAQRHNLEGIVLGTSRPDGTLDLATLTALCSHSPAMKKTLHRVVDLLPDPLEAVDIAINLGFDCILTSGGARSALEGLENIRQMIGYAAGRIEIMPGSGVTPKNAAHIVSVTGARWLHASCSAPLDPPLPANLIEFGFASSNERMTESSIIRQLAEATAVI